jgi:hypothetical protein
VDSVGLLGPSQELELAEELEASTFEELIFFNSHCLLISSIRSRVFDLV